VAEMEVGKADADGNQEMKSTFRHIKIGVSSGGNVIVKYDSATDAKSKNPMAKMYNAMIGKLLSMTTDSRGKISNFKGMDEMIAAVAKAAPGGEADADTLKSIANGIYEGFNQVMFPDKPVGPGDTWEADSQFTLPMGMPMQARQVNTLKSVKNGVATVESKAVVKMESDSDADAADEAAGLREMDMTSDATMLVNIATGMAETTTVTQKGTFDMPVGGMEMRMTMNSESKITITKGAYKPAK